MAESDSPPLRWKNQVLALVPLYLLQLSYGMSGAFPAVVTAQLQEECGSSTEDFTISDTQAAWIVSIDNLIVPVFSFSTGFLQHKFGPKYVLIFCCIPYAISWCLVSTPKSVLLIYISRLMVGISNSLVGTTVYAEEVASKELKGSLSSLQAVLRCFGSLLIFSLVPFLRWNQLFYVGLIPPIVSFLWAVFLIPESPFHLVRRGHDKKAIHNLILLHGEENAGALLQRLKEAMAELEERHRKHKETGPGLCTTMTRPDVWKPFMIVMVLAILQQFSGMTVLRAYVIRIFDEIFSAAENNNNEGNNLNNYNLSSPHTPAGEDCISHSAYISAILLSLVRLVATMTLSKMLLKAKRRTLHSVSSILTGIGLILFATLCLLLEHADDVPSNALAWLSVSAACMVVFFVQLGVQILPNLLAGELFPSDVKSHMKGAARSFTSLFIAFTLHLFPVIENSPLGASGAFYLFGGITLLSFPLGRVIIPETRDLSVEESHRLFS